MAAPSSLLWRRQWIALPFLRNDTGIACLAQWRFYQRDLPQLAGPSFSGTDRFPGFFLVEVALRRMVVEWSAITSINGRKLTIIGLSLFLLWMLQVYLAVSQHKHELLNRRGPLYALFVR
jgi:hypothetical protein